MYHARELSLFAERAPLFLDALAAYHATPVRRNGLPDLEDLPSMAGYVGHTMLLDTQYDDLAFARTIFYGPDLTNYLSHEPEGVRFCDEPDQRYIHSLVLPHYREARTVRRPTFYEVSGPILDHAYRYRRLLLPVNFMGAEAGGMVAVACEIAPRRPLTPPPAAESAWSTAIRKLRESLTIGAAIPATA